MPFAGYKDFDECVARNRDKRNPQAYCGSIKHRVEDKALAKARGEVVRAGRAPRGVARVKRTAIVEPRDILAAVKKAVEAVHESTAFKALSGPVAEYGPKKLEGSHGETWNDQAFAVAHGPDNYKSLFKKTGEVIHNISTIRKAGMNNFAVPGNLKEHLQKALAAVHGREIFDPRYKQACKLLKQVCDLLESIEKTAEVSRGGSSMLVLEASSPPHPKEPMHSAAWRHYRGKVQYLRGRKLSRGPEVNPFSGQHQGQSGVEHGHSAWDRSLPDRGQVYRHSHAGGDVEHHHQFTTQPKYHPPAEIQRAVALAVKAATVSPYPAPKRTGSVAESHQLRIARQNARMPSAMRGVMGAGDLHEHSGAVHAHPGAWETHIHKVLLPPVDNPEIKVYQPKPSQGLVDKHDIGGPHAHAFGGRAGPRAGLSWHGSPPPGSGKWRRSSSKRGWHYVRVPEKS